MRVIEVRLMLAGVDLHFDRFVAFAILLG